MLSENIQVDVAIVPSLVSSNGTTSKYFNMEGYDHALFVWSVAGMGILLTSVATVYQAKDGSAGTSAAALASTTAIMTQHTKATQFTVTPATLSAADTITITSYKSDGAAETALTFTASAAGITAGTTDSAREFNITLTASGTGSVSTALTYLAAIVNNTAYGVPGAYATASTTTLVVRARDAGDTVFTITSSSTTNLTLSVDSAIGMVQVNARNLTLSSNFTHVALNIVNESAVYTSAFCIRGMGRRYNFAQQVNVKTILA